MILKLPNLKLKGWECPYCHRLFTIFQKRMSAVLTLRVGDGNLV